MTMKITNIKTYMARFGGRSRGLIKVETDEGLYGWGESYSVGPEPRRWNPLRITSLR